MRSIRNGIPLTALVLLLAVDAPAAEFRSHPPMRPLPTPARGELADGRSHFVDPAKGDDANDGSSKSPWRSIRHALRQIKPGETLVLRGGTYYERVDVPTSGEPEQPITIRSSPGELAVIDGGLREFFDDPANAWEPLPDGAPGEYVSRKTYPQFAARPIVQAFVEVGWEPFHGLENQRPVVLGNFGDSMVPLHGYRTLADLRDTSMLWDVGGKFDKDEGVYCGPGLWFNRQTGRIHIRLAPTNLEGLGDRNYRGETDPRKLPLVISGPYGEDVVRLNGVRHIVLKDLVIRGGSGSALVNIYGAADVRLEGVTLYGGAPSLLINATEKLRVVNCAFRGLAAPWSSRASMKYRGTPAYTIITRRNQPWNRDFEFANCEFTDNHDFAWLRDCNELRFHHNYVDNFNDDGIEVGAKKRDHSLAIYQNSISRCLINFTLHEIEPDESPAEVNTGSGVYITRNVVDLRHGIFKAPPKEPDPKGSYLAEPGMLSSDHGGPVWPQYFFYHNTVVRSDPAWRGYYGFGMGAQGLRGTQRRVFNNIFVQLNGVPGLSVQPEGNDVSLDGNLHWSVVDGPSYEGNFFEKQNRVNFRNKPLPEGWLAHDTFADPKFAKLTAKVDEPFDLKLGPDSPAIDAGVPIPEEWIDPLRAEDAERPDIGALPSKTKPWRIGIDGRLSVFGEGDQ